ncbi:MAG: HAMP domain-containing sensor histidine kinase [Eubacteriales bacterium]
MKSKITKRLIITNLSILIFALVSFYAVTIYNLNDQAKQQAKQQIIAENSLVMERTERMNSLFRGFQQSNVNLAERNQNNFSMKDTYVFPSQNNSVSIHIFCELVHGVLVFPEENSFFSERLHLGDSLKEELTSMPFQVPTEISIRNEPFLVYLSQDTEEDTVIVSLLALESVNSLTTENISSFLIVLAFLVILSFLILSWQAMGITAPLKKLTAVSESYAKQDYSQPFLVETGDEIESLSHSIQSMVESILAHEKAQTALFRNLSHELKTPLTAISGYAQNIQNGYYQDNASPLSIVQEECDRIHHILDDLIFLSKIDSKIEVFSFEKQDVVSILTQSLEKVESIAILKEIDVEYEPQGEIYLSCDKEKLMRAFLNILSNGFRHTRDWLKVEIIQGETEVSFSIIDNGKGFEASKLENLFVSTTGETVDGNGLGLLIVYEIIKKHQGNIEVQNLESCGARITISLPKGN